MRNVILILCFYNFFDLIMIIRMSIKTKARVNDFCKENFSFMIRELYGKMQKCVKSNKNK